ncbi:DUF6919 domain-containing protein [Arthrobacter sp. D1-17]
MNDRFTDERDSYGRLLVDREVWRQATTLAAAGELTARWLEGKSEYQAGTLAPRFDDETGPIAGLLTNINRSGLFTRESQPGLAAEDHLQQREYVTGFCSAESARQLLQLSTLTEFITVAHAPGETSSASIPVTFDGGEVITVLGTSETPVESGQIRDWAEESNEALSLLLADSWYVEVLDPVWGRNQHLLTAVLDALDSGQEGF